jgi:seryl-tRNA synthetase
MVGALAGMEFDRESGSVQLQGAAAQLFLGWETFLRALLSPLATDILLAPGIVGRPLIDVSGYGENFPHQLVATDPVGFLPPAACLSVYPSLRSSPLPASFLTVARCGRNESGEWEPPFRLRAFTMLELILVGSRAGVAEEREAIGALVGETFSRLNIPCRLVTATDAFYLGEKSGARLIQQLKELKREYVTVLDGIAPVALCSINNHERYFAARFGLGDEDTESTCVAFGLERLTAAGLLLWGPMPADWPEELRP